MHLSRKIGRIVVSTVLGLALAATGLPSFALAPPPIEHLAKAEALSKLKIMVPVTTTTAPTAGAFELQKPALRLQAAHILVRLLTKEADLSSATYSHPFVDVPASSSAVVGYLFSKGYISDNATHTFKPQDNLDLNTYASFLLRALGYRAEAGDYTWQNAPDKAVQFGLISANELKLIKAQGMMRDELALMTYNGLKAKLKAGIPLGPEPVSAALATIPDKTLVDLGIASSVFNPTDAVMAGLARMGLYDAQICKPLFEGSFSNLVLDEYGLSTNEKIDPTYIKNLLSAFEPSTTGSSPTVASPIEPNDDWKYAYYYHTLDVKPDDEYPDLVTLHYREPDLEFLKCFETQVEFSFYKSGKLVMHVTSQTRGTYKGDSYSPYHFISVPKADFDQVKVALYKITPYEVFRKYGTPPVHVYSFKTVKEAVKKMQTATFVTSSSNPNPSDANTYSYSAQLFNALNMQPVYRPNQVPMIPMRYKEVDGSKHVENKYLNDNKIIAPKKINITKTNGYVQFSSYRSKDNKYLGEYCLYINPMTTSYFVLRDANFNPTAIICIKP